MLEKIGLPSKPSQRGNNWVVDASHCQGCSSQFTFINRKHHCRRCGGLFCNSCTSHRMVLRGQGDSPVRICEPCKTLEEATRFEMRYGNRARVGKASSKSALKSENEILSDVLGNDKKESFASGMGSSSKSGSSVERATSLNTQDGVGLDRGEKVQRSASVDAFDRGISEKEPTSPESLRQLAVEEKKKYRVLKGEGKSDEALRAFKRGKELERQADALEISLRRNRRKALVSQEVEEEVQIKDDVGGSRRGNKVACTEGKEKDDLASELRELGWSDMDLHNEDKKKPNTSLEGEFSYLLGEISDRTKTGKGSDPIDKSQVLVHKKRALELKREGNLAEAKEELKRAKVLEKQLEEQELLAEADDSDDELSALIRSMDSDKQQISSDLFEQKHDFDISNLLGAADQIIDGNFDVTDEDMEDPEIAATLSSLGWADDTDIHESNIPQVVSVDKDALSHEILSLKREALTKKRAGNVSEAMSLLKKAKLLEKDLESFESTKGEFPKDSTYQTTSHSSTPIMQSDENAKKVDSKPALRKSKLMVQKELIGLKKKALALKREGRLDEAEKELEKGKILEQQLEEMDNSPSNVKATPRAASNTVPNLAYDNLPSGNGENEDVTDQDMNDPSYLSLLENLGWQEEQNDDTPPAPVTESSVPRAVPVVAVVRPRKSKAELQRELLGLKRKALALRRQGESEEAEEVLSKAKDIEAEIAEMEQPAKEVQLDLSSEKNNKSADKDDDDDDAETVTEKDMNDPAMVSILKKLGWNGEEQQILTTHEKRNENAVESLYSDSTSVATVKKRSKGEIQRELLNLKRKALGHRRKGETEEAEEVLNMAKALEAQLEEFEAPKQVNMQEAVKDEKPNNFRPPSNCEERTNVTLDLNSQIVSDTINHGMRDSDLLIHLNSPLVETATVPPPGNSENLIDLLTGDDWGASQMPVEKHENAVPRVEKPPLANESKEDVGTKKLENISNREKPPSVNEANRAEEHASQTDEAALKQEILARKRKAVALKREGKLAEAREELRQAKLLENRGSQDNAGPAIHEPPVTTSNTNTSPVGQKDRGSSSTAPTKLLSSRDRFKLQQESLSHKRQALKLRREGRTEEADAELELAKSLEAQLEESSSHDEGGEAEGDVGVEDFLDPQLLSALRAIGIDDTARAAPRVPDQPQPSKPMVAKSSENPRQERVQLEEQIKAEKLKALQLKRSGKQAEALGVLRNAKLLEKKLNSLS